MSELYMYILEIIELKIIPEQQSSGILSKPNSCHFCFRRIFIDRTALLITWASMLNEMHVLV